MKISIDAFVIRLPLAFLCFFFYLQNIMLSWWYSIVLTTICYTTLKSKRYGILLTKTTRAKTKKS